MGQAESLEPKVIKFLVISDQQPKTERYFIYNDTKHKKQ